MINPFRKRIHVAGKTAEEQEEEEEEKKKEVKKAKKRCETKWQSVTRKEEMAEGGSKLEQEESNNAATKD